MTTTQQTTVQTASGVAAAPVAQTEIAKIVLSGPDGSDYEITCHGACDDALAVQKEVEFVLRDAADTTDRAVLGAVPAGNGSFTYILQNVEAAGILRARSGLAAGAVNSRYYANLKARRL